MQRINVAILLLLSAILAAQPPSGGATYFVSQSQGSDSNNGTSPGTPWKTVAKVNSSRFHPGDQILFYDQDVWHEEMMLRSSGVTSAPIILSAYGPNLCPLGPNTKGPQSLSCSLPILDEADPVTGWTNLTGRTYQAPYRERALKGYVDNLYSQAKALVLQSGIAAVQRTPGSLFSDGSNVYVNLPDGSNPANHIIEISATKSSGIVLPSVNSVTIDGFKIIRAVQAGVHNIDSSNITIRNSVIFNYGDTLQAGIPEGGLIAHATGPFSITGLTFNNNYIGALDTAGGINYSIAGIATYGAIGSVFDNNFIAVFNGIGLMDHDSLSKAACGNSRIAHNELTNNLGNIWNGGCPNDLITRNNVHDSAGNGIQIGTPFSPAHNATKLVLTYNEIHRVRAAYGDLLFNGVDINSGGVGTGPANGTAAYNNISGVAAADFTLETGASGWSLYGNTFDASTNYGVNGGTGLNLYIAVGSQVGLTTTGDTFIPLGANPQSIEVAGVHYTPAQFVRLFSPGSNAPGITSNHLR